MFTGEIRKSKREEKGKKESKATQRKVKDITRSKVTQEIKEKFLQLLLDMSIFCKGRRLQVQTGKVFFLPVDDSFHLNIHQSIFSTFIILNYVIVLIVLRNTNYT